jgi:hypothetical protein
MWKFVSVNKARFALFPGTNFHIKNAILVEMY